MRGGEEGGPAPPGGPLAPWEPHTSAEEFIRLFFFGSEGGSQASTDLWDLEDTGRKKGLVTE